MPTATLNYGPHAATLSWPDNTSPADIQTGIQKAKQAMTQAYGPLPTAQSAASQPPQAAANGWRPPATDIAAPAKSLDFSSQGTPAAPPAANGWKPPATDIAAPSQPIDFPSNGTPLTPPTTDSLMASIRNGTGDFFGGLAHLNQLADNAMAKATGTQPDTGFDQGFTKVAQTVHGDTDYQPRPLNSIGNVAHDAAGLIAGAAPSMLGAALTGPAAPYVLGASAAGNTLNDRMSAQGEAAPSIGDLAAAGGTALLNGIGGKAALGLGKLPGLGALGDDAKSAVVRALGRVATNAGAGATIGAGNYAADTAGTGNMNASGLVDAAGQGAAAGGLLTGVVDGASALKGLPTARAAAAMHPEQAASTVRVAQELASRVQAAKSAGNPTSTTDAATGLGGQLQGELSASIGRMKQSGVLSENDRQAVIQPLIDAAKAGTLHPGDASVPTSALAQFDALDLPGADKVPLRNGMLDLSTVTRDGTAGGMLKPFVDKLLNTSTAKAMESLGGAAIGFMHGGEPGALLGGMVGAAAPKVASALAGGVDRLTGANIPPVLKQQAAARLAVQQAGVGSPGSALADLQAARTAYMPPSGPTPEQQGQQAAAQNQAAMLSRLGPNHPVGNAAASALVASGNVDLATKALAQYSGTQGLRDAQAQQAQADALAKARAAQAAASNRQQVKDENTQGIGSARRAAQAFQMTPAEQLAYRTAVRNQAILEADEAGGHSPDADAGLTAQNATANEIAQLARRVRGTGGETPQEDAQNPLQAAATPVATVPPASPATASSDSTGLSVGQSSAAPPASGLMGLSDYLTSQALWRGGVALSPDDLKAGLDRAAGAGTLTPAQYDVLGQHIAANVPLHHAGGAATAALESVLAHALAVTNGGDVATSASGPTAPTPGPANAPTAVRDHVKYATAAVARQSTYSTATRQLTAEGMPEAAQAVADARHESDPETRASILDSLNPVERAKVRQLLGAKLYGR